MVEQIAPVEYDNAGRMKYNPDLHDRQGKLWDDDEKDYLINWYNIIGLEEMSLALGRTEGTIANKVNKLRSLGKMLIEPSRKIERILKTDNRQFNQGRLKKATKNPDQSVQSSKLRRANSKIHLHYTTWREEFKLLVKCSAKTCIYNKNDMCQAEAIKMIDFEYYESFEKKEKDYLEDEMKCSTYEYSKDYLSK